MANTHTTLTSLFIDIADAIREKTGGTDAIVADNFPSAIEAIPNKGEYVWKKLTTEGGELVDYVVSDDLSAYPDGGEQDGYWYERENGVEFADPTTQGNTVLGTFYEKPASGDPIPMNVYRVETGIEETGEDPVVSSKKLSSVKIKKVSADSEGNIYYLDRSNNFVKTDLNGDTIWQKTSTYDFIFDGEYIWTLRASYLEKLDVNGNKLQSTETRYSASSFVYVSEDYIYTREKSTYLVQYDKTGAYIYYSSSENAVCASDDWYCRITGSSSYNVSAYEMGTTNSVWSYTGSRTIYDLYAVSDGAIGICGSGTIIKIVDGQQVWSVKHDYSTNSGIDIVEDKNGCIYLLYKTNINKLSPNGEEIWDVKISTETFGELQLGEDFNLYVGLYDTTGTGYHKIDNTVRTFKLAYCEDFVS